MQPKKPRFGELREALHSLLVSAGMVVIHRTLELADVLFPPEAFDSKEGIDVVAFTLAALEREFPGVEIELNKLFEVAPGRKWSVWVTYDVVGRSAVVLFDTESQEERLSFPLPKVHIQNDRLYTNEDDAFRLRDKIVALAAIERKEAERSRK